MADFSLPRYTWPSFVTNCEVRSNKIPGEKINFVTSYKENSNFKFALDFPGSRAIDVAVALPSGGIQADSGTLLLTLATSNPLPATDAKIEVTYLFTPTLKTGDFKGRVNGKTVSISMSRESSYIGSEKLELKMDSPIPNVNHVEVST